MPKKEIVYNNSCIYKLVCNDINIKEIYIGSTTSFKDRKYKHKSRCNNENDKKYNYYVYQFIRDHGGWGNWSMVEIEKYECKDGRELQARERYYIEFLKAELNKTIPTRTSDEYYQDNKDDILEKRKQYYLDNIDKIKEYKKQYYLDNIDKLKEQKKQYSLDNKDKIKEYKKQYRLNNKDKIKEYVNQKHTCECGGRYTISHKAKHIKTTLHQTYINSLNS